MVHALHLNFAMDSLEIWNAMLIFRIKRDVCVCGRGGGGGERAVKEKEYFHHGKDSNKQ